MTKNMKEITRLIKSAASVKAGIQLIKNETPLNNFNKVFVDLNKIVYYRKSLLGNVFPKTIEDFSYSSSVYPSSDFNKELAWMSYILSIFKDEINKFLNLRKLYLKELLFSKFDSARLILDEIEDEFGISFWLIENRISLIQMSEGLEQQKEFTKKIVENENANVTIRFITSYLSIKAEKNVAPQKYDREIKSLSNALDELPYNDPYLEYLKFKVNISNIDEYDYRKILQIENELSIIDRYLTFHEVLLNLRVTNQLNLDSSTTNQIWHNLKEFNDENLKNFWILSYGEIDEFFVEERKDIIEIFDTYSLGDYNQTIMLSEKTLELYPYTTELYEVYVKSLIAEKRKSKFSDTLLAQIINNLKNIYLGSKVSMESYTDLIKISYMFSKDLWSRKLRGIAAYSFYGLSKKELNSFIYISAYISSFVKSKLLVIIQPDKSQNILDAYSRIISNSSTIFLQKYYIQMNIEGIKDLKLPENRKVKYLADTFFESGQYDNALKMYELVLEDELVFNKLEVISKIIDSLLEMDRKKEALELLVGNYFENPTIIYKMNLADVINNIEINKMDKSSLNVPIIYHLYNIYVSDDKEGARNDSYEDFLEAWGVSKPSLLGIEQFEKQKIIYFFRNICTQNIMATSIFFDSQSDVENERLIVCQKLSEIDADHISIYTDEIKDITQSRMVRKGIREIENSKIYVDIEGIKNSLQKTLRENFIRYKSFDFANNHSNPNYILIDKEINLMLPSDERWNLFSNMVIEIRDSFVSSKEYGLDGYLSVGIRHGTLSGQLRGKIESEQLITQIDSVEQKYQDNHYWIEKLGIIDKDIAQLLLTGLNDFSFSIDTLINKLKNELIQINIDNSKNINALFDYVITTEDLEFLHTKMHKDIEYNEFIDKIIDYLWERTDINLSVINNYLKNEFKLDMNVCFEKLQFDIDNLKDKVDIADLSNAIVRLKTEMQYEIDKISNWFSRRGSSEQGDYEISLPIEIGLEMANNIYKNINGYEIIEKDIPEIYLKGKTFRGLVDISFIIFENIFKHSGLNEVQKIKLSCYLEEENLIFVCINEVANYFDIDALNKIMEEKREKLKQSDVLEMVSKEGGSGFYKIYKIISIDLKCHIKMEFTYLTDFHFSIKLVISSKELLK